MDTEQMKNQIYYSLIELGESVRRMSDDELLSFMRGTELGRNVMLSSWEKLEDMPKLPRRDYNLLSLRLKVGIS